MKRPSPQQLLGLGVWAISIASGFILSALIVFVLFGTTMERYGESYFLITVASVAMMILIPLDYFLGTKILPD